MPLYVYKCVECGHEFEEIVLIKKRDEVRSCPRCEKDSNRVVVQPFGVHVKLDPKKDTIYSPKEIDKVVGEQSEKRWMGYNERWRGNYERRRQARWKGKKPEVINLPPEKDGKVSPLMHLGKKESKEIRREFTEALQEHRSERRKKGIPQFDGPGAIVE